MGNIFLLKFHLRHSTQEMLAVAFNDNLNLLDLDCIDYHVGKSRLNRGVQVNFRMLEHNRRAFGYVLEQGDHGQNL